METSVYANPSATESGSLTAGSSVVYGLHGKCTILSVDTRTIGGQSVAFYRLEVQKSALSRSTRQEPHIFVPVATARQNGLRPLLEGAQIPEVIAVLASREFYFDLSLTWSKAQHLLERTIAQEGAVGLAKALSYVTGIKKREVILSPETARFADTVSKQLLRELSDTQGIALRDVEVQVNKALKNKLLRDQ